MDFDAATKRLARDQTKARHGRRPVELSAQAKREAELRAQQQMEATSQRERERRQDVYRLQYFQQRERNLQTKYLSTLTATSIYGEGDKLALPPSVLQQLTQGMDVGLSSASSPWTFRVGLLNPDYSFPASPLMKSLTPPEDDPHDDVSDQELSDDDDDEASTRNSEAYLDELQHKYLAYTHATVVEFTQEEGNVGLPQPVVSALLDIAFRKTGTTLKTARTVDPAMAAARGLDGKDDEDQPQPMQSEDERTPGHLAWGLFDLPDMPIEITLVKLPKGKGATLTPTEEAISNGFYNLGDIKLVLEQSLIRTRATLTVGDTVYSWHRGKRFELKVSALRPSTYNAVLCLNTDLEVEFGNAGEPTSSDIAPGLSPEQGKGLDEESVPKASTAAPLGGDLPAEPAADADGVCLIQIRADAAVARRRFDVKLGTINDLFRLASSITAAEKPFQLVTRFPRRVFTLSDGARSLNDAGITTKQELLMVERL
jgi:hypothetical protein